jgi:hypothetical protein
MCVMTSCARHTSVTKAPTRDGIQDDFAFVWDSYSCYRHVRLDTTSGIQTTFTLANETDGRETPAQRVRVALSARDLRQIHDRLLTIGFFEMPPEVVFPLGQERIYVTPSRRWELAVRRNGVWTRVRWNTEHVLPLTKAMENLLALARAFENIGIATPIPGEPMTVTFVACE